MKMMSYMITIKMIKKILNPRKIIYIFSLKLTYQIKIKLKIKSY